MINHLLIIQIRVSGKLVGKYGNATEAPKADPKNLTAVPLAFYDVLYYGLFSFGPFLADNHFDKLRSMERNAVKNETFFFA